MQEREKIRQLFERYRHGNCTPEEEAHLHAWLNRYVVAEASGLDELWKIYEVDRTYKKKWLGWLPYAAALAIALSAIWYLWSDSNANLLPVDQLIVQSGDVAPGGNRATLTFADGRTIDLREAQAGIVVGNDRVVYEEDTEEIVNLETKDPLLLVLSTPRGGTYQVTLSDGTKVWLNAASTLRYPSRFGSGERVVEIEGEGYFAVVKDPKKPFKVISRGQQVEVLGTEFNISTYADDLKVKTTLVEGALMLLSEVTGANETLSPGEEGSLVNGLLSKKKVNPSSAIAWRDGSFYFDDTPVEDMLKQIARWYNVDVVYESQVPKERFSGEMSRNVTLNTVLEMLRISEINYRIQANKLIIE